MPTTLDITHGVEVTVTSGGTVEVQETVDTVNVISFGGVPLASVVKPAAFSSTDNAIARWSGTGGTTIQDSGVTIDDSDNIAAPGYIDLSEIATPSDPGADVARLYAADSDGFPTIKFVGDQGVSTDLLSQVVEVVRNNTGAQLDAGTPVYVSGSTGSNTEVDKADASDPAKMPAAGILIEDIADNGFGRMVTAGRADFDTSSFTAGDVLYVSDSTPGALAATRPAHPNLAQHVADVTVDGVGNGQVLVRLDSPEGDEQGTRQTTWNVGDDATATINVAYGASGGTGTLAWTPTAARTLTLPDVTATLGAASQPQLISQGNFNVNTTINDDAGLVVVTRTGAGNQTLTLPATEDSLVDAVTIRHATSGGNTGTCTVGPDGTDTIAGSGSSITIPVGATLIVASDQQAPGDWRILKQIVDDRVLEQVTPLGDGTINVRGWAPYAGYIVGIRVRMSTVNTVGSYDLAITNEDTGNSLLASSPFDMTGLSADTPTALTLTTTYADRALPDGGQWTAAFTSDNVGFDGKGIYIEVQYAVSGV